MWQDIGITVITYLFGVMLLPQVREVYRGATINSLSGALYTAGFFALGYIFVTLRLWISVSAFIFTGIIWLLTTVLSLRNARREKGE